MEILYDPCPLRRPPTQVKSLDWVQQRKELEAEQPADFDETLLCEAGGITEGLQTNFVALLDGEVWTAADEEVRGTCLRCGVSKRSEHLLQRSEGEAVM